MPRFDLLFICSVGLALGAQAASAQRATLMVTARVLPPAEATASGRVAPSVMSAHTVVASARLLDCQLLPSPSASSAADVAGVAEFKLGVVVSANVQYRMEASSNVEQVTVERHRTEGRQNITYRVRATANPQPTPASVTVTLTASSIS